MGHHYFRAKAIVSNQQVKVKLLSSSHLMVHEGVRGGVGWGAAALFCLLAEKFVKDTNSSSTLQHLMCRLCWIQKRIFGWKPWQRVYLCVCVCWGGGGIWLKGVSFRRFGRGFPKDNFWMVGFFMVFWSEWFFVGFWITNFFRVRL